MHDDFPRIKLEDLQAEYPGVFAGARWVDVGTGWLPLIRSFVAEALPHDPSLTVHVRKNGALSGFGETPMSCRRASPNRRLR